ncbi:MAG: hypothetical protein ACFFB5_14005 [Promethearchaeota archaeon]
MSLMFNLQQQEGRRVVAGYLWVTFVLITNIAFRLYVLDFTTSESVFHLLSIYVFLSSLITIPLLIFRIEKPLDPLIFGHTLASVRHPLVVRKWDAFWGDLLSALALFMTAFIPLDQIIPAEAVEFYSLVKYVLCFLSCIIIIIITLLYKRPEIIKITDLIFQYERLLSKIAALEVPIPYEKTIEVEKSILEGVHMKTKVFLEDLRNYAEKKGFESMKPKSMNDNL